MFDTLVSKLQSARMKNSKKVEENILRAARKIFTLHGRKGATMAEIAEEAGISRTLLNYYYRDKDKLFEGVFNDILTHFLPNINEAFEDNSSIMEKIGRVIDIYTDVLLENPDIPVFIINQINTDPDHLIKTVEGISNFTETRAKISKRLEAEMNYGSIRRIPTIDIITTFLGMVTFPFLGKNALEKAFKLEDADEYKNYILGRKALVFDTMKNLLERRQKNIFSWS